MVNTRADALDDASISQSLSARLLERGLIDDMGLRRAVRAQRQSGERLDLVLARLGLVAERELRDLLSELMGLPLADSSRFPAAPVLAGVIEPQFLKVKRILPLEDRPDRLVVAVADPFDTASASALAFHVDRPVERQLAVPGDLDQALQRLYGSDATAALASAAVHERPATSQDDDVRRLVDLASEAPVIKLLQDLIVRAVDARASDIHVEPRTDSLRVRFRIDGVLHTVETLSPEIGPGLTSRIKILARLDIAERRLPQDGRAKTAVRGRDLDLRVSTVPTMSGESCVLRILDRGNVPLDFAALGFATRLVDDLSALLRQPHGIVLVTGPTGSGKTTTLYTALGSLDVEAAKVLTVEDPIEYRLPDINQIQVQPRIGLTFASALRSILRQDPDVIMVGEIRDFDTAQIAIQASLTGHLVLSTVHTNSAATTITRLLDMGVEGFLLASSVTGVMAQRLVRRLCTACAEPHAASRQLIDRCRAEGGAALLGWKGPARPMMRVGCAECRNTGYQGRLAIGELLTVDGDIRRIIQAGGSDQEIEAAAIAAGMATLYQSGLALVVSGDTTMEEVLRVTRLG